MTDPVVLVALLPFAAFSRALRQAAFSSKSRRQQQQPQQQRKRKKKKKLQQRSFDKAAAAYLAGPDKQANRLNWLGAAEEPISSPALQMAPIFHSRLFFQLYKTCYLHSITLIGP